MAIAQSSKLCTVTFFSFTKAHILTKMTILGADQTLIFFRLVMLIGHYKEIEKLTFRPLALKLKLNLTTVTNSHYQLS